MNELVKGSGPHRFEPGNMHGKGRPKGARNKIGADLIDAMDRITSNPELAEAHVMRLYNDFPEAFAKLWAMIGIAKESVSKLQIEQKLPGNLDPESYATLRRVVQLIESYAPAGAEPGDVFETVEAALIRAFEAPQPMAIEHKPAMPMVLAPPPYSR
jgi:hypothetical protein